MRSRRVNQRITSWSPTDGPPRLHLPRTPRILPGRKSELSPFAVGGRPAPEGVLPPAAGPGRIALAYWDRVADGDCVVTDEHLFDQQTNDTLTLSHVQRLCRRGQPGHERGQCLGQPQMGRAVFCLVDNGLQFGFERLLSPSQFRCSGPPSGWQWCAPPSAA